MNIKHIWLKFNLLKLNNLVEVTVIDTRYRQNFS